MTPSQTDKDRLAKKVILCLIVTFIAFFAIRFTYLESMVVMGNGWKSTQQITVLGTPYKPMENADAQQIADMYSQLLYSKLLVVCIWAIAVVIIVCWRARKQPIS